MNYRKVKQSRGPLKNVKYIEHVRLTETDWKQYDKGDLCLICVFVELNETKLKQLGSELIWDRE